MATLTLPALAKKMKEIDYCMMVTLSKSGNFNSRPMSNNQDVNWNGESFYFTFEKSKKIKDLENDSHVSLNFEGEDGMFISVTGKAKLIRDQVKFEEHWDNSLDRWFPDGPSTKGVVLIHVKGIKLSYWHKEDQGEVKLGGKR